MAMNYNDWVKFVTWLECLPKCWAEVVLLYMLFIFSFLSSLANLFICVYANAAAIRHGEMDDFIVSSMILCGIPLDESYLQHRLSGIIKDEMNSLKGGKLPISESFYLMGTVDPTGVLKSDEVCIIL